jgi:hypothetical protein
MVFFSVANSLQYCILTHLLSPLGVFIISKIESPNGDFIAEDSEIMDLHAQFEKPALVHSLWRNNPAAAVFV